MRCVCQSWAQLLLGQLLSSRFEMPRMEGQVEMGETGETGEDFDLLRREMSAFKGQSENSGDRLVDDRTRMAQ